MKNKKEGKWSDKRKSKIYLPESAIASKSLEVVAEGRGATSITQFWFKFYIFKIAGVGIVSLSKKY